jgi:hypothetical protein
MILSKQALYNLNQAKISDNDMRFEVINNEENYMNDVIYIHVCEFELDITCSEMYE